MLYTEQFVICLYWFLFKVPFSQVFKFLFALPVEGQSEECEGKGKSNLERVG